MSNLDGLGSVVARLKEQRYQLADRLEKVEAAIAALGGLKSGATNHFQQTRTMSPAARRKISLAQKARWARRNGQPSAGSKPVLSVAARNKIAAAQRARWAKWRKAQKA